MKYASKMLAMLCVSLLVAATAQAAAIAVPNGDFESDASGSTNVTSWTEPVGDIGVWLIGGDNYMGNYNTQYGSYTAENDLGTAIEASKTYTISYEYGNGHTQTSPASATWTVEFGTLNGGTFTALATDTNTETVSGTSHHFSIGNETATSFQFTTSGSVSGDNLAIRASADGGAGWMAFDNFTVDVVPEPATMSLLGIGGLLALVRRRRK